VAMAASKKVSYFESDDHPYSTCGTRFHTNRVNLGIGMIQVAVRKPMEDFCGRLAGARDLARPFIEVGQTWAGCSKLTNIPKFLQRM